MNGYVFVLDEESSEDNLVALNVGLPDGHLLQIWAEVTLEGRTAILRQFAIYSRDTKPYALGAARLLRLAQAAMEEFDVDSIRIEEARRTSGANPNRTLKTIDLKRR
ncbi:MAG: hypothetical protein AB7R90_02265 [Reyranellaceae bacterium]